MKLLSNETWDKYQELKTRDWKQTEKIKREHMDMQNDLFRDFHYGFQQTEINLNNEIQRIKDRAEEKEFSLNHLIKIQRKEITKQHIDIDKLQKLLKRKKND